MAVYRRTLVILLLGLAVLPPGGPASAAPDSESSRAGDAAPPFGQRTSLALELRYTLRADLAFDAGRIRVEETIVVTNRSGGPVTYLDLYLMARAFGELERGPLVRVGKRPVQARWINNANLRVPLPDTLRAGASTRIHLSFGLRAGADVSSSLQARLARRGNLMNVGHWFFTVGPGHAARYPGDALASIAAERIDLRLRHRRGLVVAAPGRLVSSTPTSKHYRHGPARDYAFAVSPAFRRVSGMAGGVRVEVYARSATAARAALATARTAIVRYQSVLPDYPWERLVLAESPRLGHGTEYAGFIMVGGSSLRNALLVAHEVAHMWFQSMVGNDQFAEPWVDESLAEFLSRHFFGTRAAHCSTRPVDSAVWEFPNMQAPLTSGTCGSYDQTVYLKGQAMYQGLRARMGSGRLFGALAALAREQRWDWATTADLREVLIRFGAPRRFLDAFLRRS
jgi:hypothetical protein